MYAYEIKYINKEIFFHKFRPIQIINNSLIVNNYKIRIINYTYNFIPRVMLVTISNYLYIYI